MLAIFGLFSLLALGLHGLASPPQCQNSTGEPVDWWLIIKESGGLRYVYYDSKMAQEAGHGKHTFRAMNDIYKLNDPLTSPVLRTIYTPVGIAIDPALSSDMVFIGVNDQPAQKEGKNERDAFKAPISDNSGHVKFFTAAQVEYGPRPDRDEASIYSYLIQHSLPRFPNVNLNEAGTHGRIFANALPASQASIFDSNVTEKGQHFMCMSFHDRQRLDDAPEVATGVYKHQLKYRRAEMSTFLQDRSHHFACILHYLKVVHGLVVATNYDPFKASLGVFHQYLNTYNQWSEAETREQGLESNANMSRTSLAKNNLNYDSPHLCPMWPMKKRVKLRADGGIEKTKTYVRDTFVLRNSRDPMKGSCRNGQMNDKLCLASAHLRTTVRHHQIESTLLMKNRTVVLGLYDDLIAPLARAETPIETGMIVQTWIDNATLPMAHKTEGLLLTIENSTGITLPILGADGSTSSTSMASLGTDHSKWAMLIPRGQLGTVQSLFCTCDLNRTYRQEERGGAALCQTDPLFVELMAGLSPSVSKAFLDKKIPFDRLQHLYQGMHREGKVSLVTFKEEGEEEDHRCPVMFLGSTRSNGNFAAYQLPNPYGVGTAGAMVPEGVIEILGDRLPTLPEGFIDLNDLL